MEARQSSSIRVLMMPWLAHGHVSPYLELAKKLAERNFIVFFCSTPINLTSNNKKLSGMSDNPKYSGSIHPVELHLPSSLELPPQHHTTKGLPPRLMPALKQAFDAASPGFSALLRTLNPDVVVYDFSQKWVADSASSLNIPAVQFLTLSPSFVSFFLHLCENPGEGFPFPEIHVPEYLQDKLKAFVRSGDPEMVRFVESLKKSSDLVLIKSSREIEGKYMNYLSSLVDKKIQPVGMLVQDPVDQEGDEEEIMDWLKNKEEASTVFVSFGSEYFLSTEEIEEIALGLELSSANFIWVVRFLSSEKISVSEALLPEGFIKRVGERGKIVPGWAPQAKILKHPSIGGFVSHCGWNSVLESMSFAVPIVALPMHLDQPLNAILVEAIGVGLEVIRDRSGKINGEELGRVIKQVVVEKKGIQMSCKARELRKKVAMKEDEEMDEAVQELVKLCEKMK
ncbi:UDP-glucosyltransferase 29-like [Diospyros lotus]|uniref:UDP-glucosyltransferase 29-like n=1 Tax=Diospyros lotus TaxID=55363 RepID=UPI002253F2CA|nr:UDP-glucosyltransferase 29-like [Diospyros lotus]